MLSAMQSLHLVIVILYLSRSVVSSQPFQVSTSLSGIPSTQPVRVSCVFDNTWLAATHPMDYPSSNAHWSPMVVVSHSGDYEMWAPSQLASPGVQSVAETGSTSTLNDELDGAGDDVLDRAQGQVIFLDTETQVVLDAVEMNEEHSFLSTITMIAPSPDWFSGFSNFNVLDESGFWYEAIVISTFPWDAGTDSGDTYASPNDATDPPENIFQLTVDTIPDTTNVFLSPTGDSVLPVAAWTCSVEASGTVLPPTTIMEESNVPSASPSVPIMSAAPSTSPSVRMASAEPSASPTIMESLETSMSPMPVNAELPTDIDTVVPANSAAPSVGMDTNMPTTTTPAPAPFTVAVVPGSTPRTTNVRVTCAFQNKWTAERHPNDYPEGMAMWSPMVMASHSNVYQMWGSPGVLASDGVKLIAETGNTSTLITEMNDAGFHVMDQEFGAPLMLVANQTQSSLVGPLALDSSRPYISAISMSAPSPDWFTGFYDFNLISETTGTWYQSFVVLSYPWDAGTDSGDTYLAEDSPIDSPLWISQLTADTLPPSQVFLDPEGKTVLPVAMWNCNVDAAPDGGTDDALFSSGALSISSLSVTCWLAPFVASMMYNVL